MIDLIIGNGSLLRMIAIPVCGFAGIVIVVKLVEKSFIWAWVFAGLLIWFALI